MDSVRASFRVTLCQKARTQLQRQKLRSDPTVVQAVFEELGVKDRAFPVLVLSLSFF